MASKANSGAIVGGEKIEAARLDSGGWGVRIIGDDHAGRTGKVTFTTRRGRTMTKTLGVAVKSGVIDGKRAQEEPEVAGLPWTIYADKDGDKGTIPADAVPTAEFEYRDGDGDLTGEVNVYVVNGVTMLQLVPVRGGKAQRAAVLVLADTVRELVDDLATVPAGPPPAPAAKRRPAPAAEAKKAPARKSGRR